jgi:hypothetical protein
MSTQYQRWKSEMKPALFNNIIFSRVLLKYE